MLSNNIVKISAAGAGKTWDICHDALTVTEAGDKKVLITTYTNRGANSIRNEIRKQNQGVLSSRVVVKTWYELLMSDFIKPYQSSLTGISINEIKTFDFSDMYGKINYAKQGTKRRYLTNHSLVRANEASDLALLLNRLSGGKVLKRIEAIYSYVYFDEVQDLSGADVDLLKLLIHSKVAVTCCGDNKQATYSTHNARKNKRLTGSNIWLFFQELEKKQLISIQRNLNTRRFNGQICAFANKIFPIGDSISTIMDNETCHDGVYLISQDDIELYYEYFKPQILKYDARTEIEKYRTLNFGACKGETFDRVLIFPNGPFEKFILKRETLSSPEKYYVAVTRARYSVAFVIKKMPKNLSGFRKVDIMLGQSIIKGFQYIADDKDNEK